MKSAFLPLAALAGGLLPLQFALNAELSRHTGSVTATAAVSYGTGALGLLLGLLLAHRGRVPLGRLRGAPAWSLLGGLVGSAYVVGSVVLTRSLGPGLAVALVIAAQTLTGLALDHFGALGLARRPFNPTRALALGLVVAALALQVRP